VFSAAEVFRSRVTVGEHPCNRLTLIGRAIVVQPALEFERLFVGGKEINLGILNAPRARMKVGASQHRILAVTVNDLLPMDAATALELSSPIHLAVLASCAFIMG
jgi:hypothetical protein